MVGLSQGFPLATQPIVDPKTGLATRSWLSFFQGLWSNASQTTLPAGITLPPESVTLQAFAKFLNPVGLVEGLPNPVGYKGPLVVFNTDGNLYRYVNGAWTLDVPAAAIVGEIPLGNIPAIPTTQLTGYIAAGQIQANSIGADQISAGYIYAGHIAASQIQAGTLGAGVILASDISAGQITTGTLTGITISGNTITGGSITGTTFQTVGGVGSSSAGVVITSGASGGLSGYNTTPALTVAIDPTGTAFIIETVNISGQIFSGGGNFFATCSGSTPGFRANGNTSGAYAFQADSGGFKIVDSSPITMGGGNITGVGDISFSGSGNLLTDSGNPVIGYSGGAVYVGNGSFPVYTNNNFSAVSANTFTCGTNALPWAGGYTQVAFTVTSDRDLKTNIEDETLGIDFINALRPVTGEWKSKSDGIHHWLIAQEVDEALKGVPFAGLHRPIDDEGHWGIVYEELIPPIIKAIQELSADIAALKQAA